MTTIYRKRAEKLSGDELVQWMLKHMQRDIDMECPMFDPNPLTWENYMDEIVKFVEANPFIANFLPEL